MNRLNDLRAVDSLQVNRRDSEVGMSELALDNDQRHTRVGHLDRVSMTELVRREAATHASRGGGHPQLLPRR